MAFPPRAQPRILRVVLLATLALTLWSVGVYHYQVHSLYVLESGVWFPTYDVYYLVTTFIQGLSEQSVSLLGLALLSFTPVFRRAFKGRQERGDAAALFLAFAGLELAFALQQVWLEQTGEVRNSFGLFLPMVAGLTGGWRLGVKIGVLNTFALGAVDYLGYRRDDPSMTISYVRTTLTFVNLIVPIWAGGLTGLLGERLGQRRFNPLLALSLAVGAEATLIFFTLMSTWLPPQMFARFLNNLVVTPLLAGYTLLVRYQLARSHAPLKQTQAELAVAEAELRALRAQINPHFLLNALSVIHHLVRTQPEKARELILDLSDLFQHSLRSGQFVPLAQELEHVRAYLALEQARLTNRLNVSWTVLAGDKLQTLVPTLCLQPLVENAVKHGIAPQTEGGSLSLLVKQVGGDIVVQVDDNGVGFETAGLPEQASPLSESSKAAGTEPRSSLGLRNIDRRLRLLYGADYGLEITSTPGVGTTALLRVPLRPAASAEALGAPVFPAKPTEAGLEADAVSTVKETAKEIRAPSDR